MRPMRRLAALVLGCGVWMAGCDPTPGPTDDPAAPVASPDAPAPRVERAVEAAADAELVAHGKALVSTYECNRCHSIPGIDAPPLEFDCVGCHQQILAGTFEAEPEELARYQSRLHSLDDVPSLTGTDRFSRRWVESFLPDAYDVRPNLSASMPRFRMPAEDARALAAFLVPTAETEAAPLGDADVGRSLLESKGCMSCHRFTGVPALAARPTPQPLEATVFARGQKLAPDLRFARDRLRPSALTKWIMDPKAIKADAQMPDLKVGEDEARHIAAYLVGAPLAEPPLDPLPAHAPRLDREVTYAEVYERIFGKVCRHCHSDPNLVIGDGGPGYSGGFGFPQRALDLSSYEGLRSGSRDDQGKRRSVFKAVEDGQPRIVAHLYARHAEVAGQPVEGIRGMPLGLAPLPLEDIALLETWIAQGRKKGATP